jgi:hypothetical protein
VAALKVCPEAAWRGSWQALNDLEEAGRGL